MDTEEWRPVVGYEGLYEVSNHGRVRSLSRTLHCSSHVRQYRGRIIKPNPTPPTNYLAVGLTRDKRRVTKRVHLIVLEAFVGPRPAPEFDACHNNGIKDDLRVENLRWDTKSANMQDCLRAGDNPRARQTHCLRGHKFTIKNTYITTVGGRQCRTCIRLARGVKQPRV
ncbi:NUMOD4 domain-containing protein [Mycobacteroides abscessus]|uniref:NUMOD4 domain-containing protein n=1 Tax=Mycobacteroides abscessus TaxID=36809 RepID=UPI0009A81D57|nr:NUMOD4 motif [Mycobacteroides abscessus subsp. abscessus]